MKGLAFAAGLTAIIATSASAQTNLVILTGSTSGVYYPLGNGISDILIKSIHGAQSRVQVTKGPVENLKLLNAGEGELAATYGLLHKDFRLEPHGTVDLKGRWKLIFCSAGLDEVIK